MIRRETPADAAAVFEANEFAFGALLEARLVAALRGVAGCISLVATLEERVVGHILFSPVTIDGMPQLRAAGLAPMCVRPEHQRRGIGSALVRAGLAACGEQAYGAVVVVGHPEYYPRFGFVPAHSKGLRCEYIVPPDAFMVCELLEGALASAGGLVRYREEFSTVAP